MGFYCRSCYVQHRTDYCPRQKKKEDALAAKEAETKAVCPNCEKEKKIPEGDYICAVCRLEQMPSFCITIPETSITLKEIEVSALTEVLLKRGVGFSVEARN